MQYSSIQNEMSVLNNGLSIPFKEFENKDDDGNNGYGDYQEPFLGYKVADLFHNPLSVIRLCLGHTGR